MSKLILGTAEWNPSGYNNELPPTRKEIRKILSCAKEAGIDIIDTAEAYNCHEVIVSEAKGFCIYTKTRNWKINLNWGDNELRGILYHYTQDEPRTDLPFIHRWVNLGASVYNKQQLPEERTRILQVPFNLEDLTFKNCFDDWRTVFVRSVFARGELLKRYSIQDCLAYVKQFRPDGIIVGVKTAGELEEIIHAFTL